MNKQNTSDHVKPKIAAGGQPTVVGTQSGKRPFSETINMELGQVAEKLRDHKNLTAFLEHLESVEAKSDSEHQWNFAAAGSPENRVSMNVGFNMIASDNLFTWTATDKAGFDYTLVMQLSPAQANRGTVVRLLASYDTKTGALAGFFEKMMGVDASVNSKKTLQRFKAFCETGSCPTTQGQPSGRDEQSPTMKH